VKKTKNATRKDKKIYLKYFDAPEASE